MNKEDIENYISKEDIMDIAKASGMKPLSVMRVLNGKVKRSKCKKFIMARIRKNKELDF